LEKAGRSYFVIRREWIFMRSSALRKGDFVDIVSQDGKTAFGRFAVAFVKNAEEKEVTEKEGAAAFLQGGGSDRSAGSDPIDHVEIVTDLEGYMAIKAFAEQQPGPALILVKREGMS
jgi:hypothetical protein